MDHQCVDGIRYLDGDATQPVGEDNKFIIHCCNNKRKWGAGFVLALSNRWPSTKTAYLDSNMELGSCSIIKVEPDIFVINIIAQNGLGRRRIRYVDYEALRIACSNIRSFVMKFKGSIHAPRLGSGLAGGKWSIIERILVEEFVNHGIQVTIYTPF
jgi:O-acetyl-ADP-ribose deacetylase (regulator of RNase III)